jgi:hypothetical protein
MPAADDTSDDPSRREPSSDEPERDTKPDPNETDDASDDDLRDLLQLANTERSLREGARWRRIEAPLNPYRHLIEGVTP